MSKKIPLDLLEAQSEETSSEKLAELWCRSRSIKVRKAVASNPNASPMVLKAAARLYLEEVVKNPGFEMLSLFDTGDNWIQDIAKAYDDPYSFILGKGIYYWNRANADSLLRACLLSKNLSAMPLNRILEYMPRSSLRRTIKNPEVRDRVRYLLVSELKRLNIWPFDLGSVIILYMEKVISREELKACLMNYSIGSTSVRKRLYTSFVNQLQMEYRNATTPEDKELMLELISRVVIVSRSHTLSWMYGAFNNDDLLTWSGELYSRVLEVISSSKVRRILISDNVRWVGSVVSSYLRLKFFTAKNGGHSYSKEGLEAAFAFIKQRNLTKETFSEYGLVLPSKEASQQLAGCSLEVKEFFIRTGCLGSWVSVHGNDPKYAIAEEVNNALYEKDGIEADLLFNSCSIRKIVTFDEATHIY